MSRHHQLSLRLILLIYVLLFLTNNLAPLHAQSPYQEAPMLAERVKAGKLPPIDKRLPGNPVVVQPQEKIGIYGGTWHVGMVGNDRNFLYRILGYETLMRWDSEYTGVIPNVAQSFKVNADATEYTFSLRDGIRWSDGEPFSVDDIMFWYQGVLLNKALTPSIPTWLLTNGKPFTVEKMDDHTILFRFPAPNGLFLQRLATPDAIAMTSYPQHYLAQFHKDYNPNVDDLVKKAGVADWVALFTKVMPYASFSLNKDVPTINPWIWETDYLAAVGGKGDLRAVRNPYYWKVDTDFNQLPYIDYVSFFVVKDAAALNALAVKGQIDMQDRRIDSSVADPEKMKQGNYHTYNTIKADSNILAIALNLTHDDPVKRALFQNRDFRIGLSYAIDRAKISTSEPYQVAPLPETPLYNEQMARQYTEYNLDKANSYLDKAGFNKRDGQNFRLGADGKRLSFKMEVCDCLSVDMVKQVQANWQAVGIDMSLEILPRAQVEALMSNNQFDAMVWSGDGGLEVILEPRYYFPFSNASIYAPLWAKWYLNPKDSAAEEPPADIKRQMELYNQLQATSDSDKQIEIMKQVIQIAADQFYVMGIARTADGYGVVKNNFHNVPAVIPDSSKYPNPAPTNPCQYYIDPQ